MHFQQDTRDGEYREIITTGLEEFFPSSDEMIFVPPELPFSNKEINEAGELLARGNRPSSDPEIASKSLIVSQWRSAHEYPLQRVMAILRKHVNSQNWKNAIVSGRTKRLNSIVAKLVRTPTMMLSTMQDLGGCRITLDSIDKVEALAAAVRSSLVNQLSRGGEIREYNYITKPKPDGYRSIHFVVRYQSGSRQHKVLRTEIQIRTLLQHRWATAVETVDLFTGQTLKTGGGDARWKRFFALTGSLFALKENREIVPGTPHATQLSDDINALARELQVLERLQGWSQAMRSILEQPRVEKQYDAYYLVEIDVNAKTTHVRTFNAAMGDVEEAHARYRAVEQEIAKFPNRSVVLVSAHSLGEVKQGYPGYYGDTQTFLAELKLPRIRPQFSR